MSGSGMENDWRPGASRHAMEARAKLLADIRAFFNDRRVMEVETPLTSRFGNVDPNLHSVSTNDSPTRFLRTSPEYAMKRLLASGHRDIYELGRVFRAAEAGQYHNPEFTLLEWYRSGMHYHELASEVVDLVRACGRGRFDDWPEQRISYRDLFTQHTGLDPLDCDESQLAACVEERGIVAGPLDLQEWLDLVMGSIVQPGLHGETLTVVYDYPPEQAALARLRPDDPPVAERFELYVGQMELANGYQELTDAAEQLRRFERESRHREIRGEEKIPIDTGLVAALQSGMPECSGVALGVDRLLMSILKIDNIDSVLAFSSRRI
jgi:lysyl-tRNA synthetase class 2